MAVDPTPADIKLPVSVNSPTHLARIIRELETAEDSLHQASLRGQVASLPIASPLLEDILSLNHLNLNQRTDRALLYNFLDAVNQRAPVIHVSFAANPSAAFVAKLVMWLRSNLHPQILVRIGLEPAIAAGCIIRTNNHEFDFSLREHFTTKRQILIDRLYGKAGVKQ